MGIDVEVERTRTPSAPPKGNLGFGQYFTDHMLVCRYEDGHWGTPRVAPRAPLSLDPAAGALQYGQSLFEGLKAFHWADGSTRVFRPLDHAKRFASGATRLCMPAIDEERWLAGIRAFLETERAFIPTEPGTSLYLRPTLIGTEAFLGVRPSKSYLFYVVASPVGNYWSSGFGPVRIWVEQEYARAAHGGVGAAKTGGNYAASLLAAEQAKKRGCAQVLWLDSRERSFIEEIGTMNLFIRTREGLLTPPLDGTLLAGITRDTVIQLAREWNVPVLERPIRIEEVEKAQADGQLIEIFGTGTAAVITPISELVFHDKPALQVGGGKIGELTTKLYETIGAMQAGKAPDPRGWFVQV